MRMLPIFSRFLYILCPCKTQYRYQLAINSEINCLQFRDTFQFYRIQTKCLHLWEGKNTHGVKYPIHTRIYIFSILRKILLQKIAYTRISTLAFPFSIMSNDSILKPTRPFSIHLRYSKISGCIFRFVHVRTTLCPWHAPDIRRNRAQRRGGEGASSAGEARNCILLPGAFLPREKLDVAPPPSACGFVNCFHDNSPTSFTRWKRHRELPLSPPRPIVIYANPPPHASPLIRAVF